MDKEVLTELAYYISAMKETAEKLEEAVKKNEPEKVLKAKKIILDFQKEIEKII